MASNGIVSDLASKDCKESLETVKRLIDTFTGHKGCLSAAGKQLKKFVNQDDPRYSEKCWTLLHLAAVRKDVSVAELLLSHGADVNAKDTNGKTPIYYAIENADVDLTKLLLHHGASLKVKDCRGLLQTAVEVESIEIVKLLLQHDTEMINEFDESKLRTALHCTALTPSPKNEANEKNDDNEKRSEAKRAEIAELLLKSGANVHEFNDALKTPLHVAAETGSTRIVEILLEHNGNVNIKGELRRTPLHYAAYKGNLKVAEILLRKGANVKNIDGDRQTALHVASEEGHEKIVELLLDHGAAVDAIDRYGRTALHTACISAKLKVVLVLLDYGADLNIKSKDFSTALNYSNIPVLYEQFPEEMTVAFIERLKNCPDLRVYQEVTDVLEERIIKMISLGLFVDDDNILLIQLKNYVNFHESCMQEIDNMRITKIGDSTVSFYDILRKDDSQVATYLANKSVAQASTSKDYKDTYPIYCDMISSSFKRGQRRKDLLDSAMNSLDVIVGYPLPAILSTKMLRLLIDEDLKNLTKAYC